LSCGIPDTNPDILIVQLYVFELEIYHGRGELGQGLIMNKPPKDGSLAYIAIANQYNLILLA